MKITAMSLLILTVGVGPAVGAETDSIEVKPWKTLPAPMEAPEADSTGYVSVNGVKIYFTITGSDDPLILLHGGLGNSDHWGGQIGAFSERYQVICIDSRGHGRSARDDQPFSYRLMASDVLAVMDSLGIEKASMVGWSDGGNIGLDIAINNPQRLAKLFAFGANYDPSGVLPTVQSDSVFGAYMGVAAADYGRLSETPDQFGDFVAQISGMWGSEPKFTPDQLQSIKAPVAISEGEYTEGISIEHTTQLAELIPGATLVILPKLSHFGLWQDPAAFNSAVLEFLAQE